MDERLYGVAEQQGGYFTAAQVREAGISRPLIAYHARAGHVVRVSHGVYRLKQFPASPFEDLFAAWLRAGPQSVISHESALAIYELSDVLPGGVHVTIPRSGSRRRPGIRLHTSRLSPEDITWRGGLPVTTVERTIVDVARTGIAVEQVEGAIRDALSRGMTDDHSLRTVATRHGGRAARIIGAILKKLEAT